MMDFRDFQFRFARHIRDPRVAPRPDGVPARRMKVYNELLYNNLEGFLLACFPICRRVLGERRWRRLVRRFFTAHRCQTPYFRQIPQEFVAWLLEARPEEATAPDWLIPLAHYEWVELAVDVMDVPPPDACRADGDLLTGRPVVAPAHMLVGYAWPVHRAAPRRRLAPEASQFMVYRDGADQVRFVELNPVTARLLALLEPGVLTGAAALAQIANELDHPDPAALAAHGVALMEDLRARGAIVGAIASPDPGEQP